MIKLSARISVAVALFCFGIAHAQPSLTQIQTELVGSWFVIVEGAGSKERVLIVTNVSQKSEDLFSLTARFGFLPTGSPASAAEITQTANERRLNLTSKSGAKIVATQTPEGAFIGSFFATDDQAYPVKITRASEGELRTKVEAVLKGREIQTIIPPDSSVPKDCAVFSGAWGGEWRNGGYRSVLRVLSIDSSCIAAYSINGLTGKTKIGDGKLEEFLCLQRTDGRCTFKYSASDDTLSANYWNPSGGINYGTFSRVK